MERNRHPSKLPRWRVTLTVARGYQVELTCVCGHARTIEAHGLLKTFKPGTRLDAIATRCRCDVCNALGKVHWEVRDEIEAPPW